MTRKKGCKRQDLPIDMVYEILVRLSVKALCRLKSVSKAWYSLISNSSFQKYHHLLRQCHQNSFLLLNTKTNDGIHTLHFSTFTHEFTPLTNFSKTVPVQRNNYHTLTNFLPVGSCLGLLCIGSLSDTNILVCNPTTQELIALPPPPVQGYLQCIGFGYAASTEEFKVVRLFYDQRSNGGENCCEVFTLGRRDGWRKTIGPSFAPRWQAPLLHGALHLTPKMAYQGGSQYIVAFDIDAGKYRTVPFPEILEVLKYEPVKYELLVVIRETLCLAFYFKTTKMLELWFLTDYHNGKWVKEYRIDFSSADSLILPYPLAFMRDEIIFLKLHRGKEQNELWWYNIGGRCITRKKKYGNCSINLFVETFFPLRTD